MKKCTKCSEEKPHGEFHKDASRKDGLYYVCKPCRSTHYKHDVTKNRTKALTSLYGISTQERTNLFLAQGGMCAICGVETDDQWELHTDHDHETGRVRGLLCFSCNTGLGKFGDSVDGLEKAIEYLRGERG